LAPSGVPIIEPEFGETEAGGKKRRKQKARAASRNAIE